MTDHCVSSRADQQQRNAWIMPAKVITSIFSMVACVVSLLVGVAVDNPLETILWNALVAGMLCYIVGAIFSTVAVKVVDDHIQTLKEQNPIPDLNKLKHENDGIYVAHPVGEEHAASTSSSQNQSNDAQSHNSDLDPSDNTQSEDRQAA